MFSSLDDSLVILDLPHAAVQECQGALALTVRKERCNNPEQLFQPFAKLLTNNLDAPFAMPKYDFDETVRINEYRVQALNQQDLDRNFCLATTHLLKWMQAGRMEMPWMQAGYRALSMLEPKMTRRLLVASQVLKVVKPGILAEAVDREVVTRCEVGDIGRTSIEFRYQILFGSELVAHGATVMIVTAGTPGNFKPSPVPDDVRALAAKEPGEVKQFMTDALAEMPKEPSANAYTIPLVVRFSDEDVNKHANHSAQARYFEDAKETILSDPDADPALKAIAEQQLIAISIAYQAEARALDVCEIKVSTSSPGSLDIWVLRLKPNAFGGSVGPVARGRLLCGGGKMIDSETLRSRGLKSSAGVLAKL